MASSRPSGLSWRTDWVRFVYAVCLLGASVTHASIAWIHGILWDYGGVAGVTRVFWTSLTFLDPLAVILLLVGSRVGLVLAFAIILADVVHNTWFGLRHGVSLSSAGWMYYSQLGFLLFVVLTLRSAWRASRAVNL